MGGFFDDVHEALSYKHSFHPHAHDISRMSEHGFKHLKAAAAHVLGESHNGEPILPNHHIVKSAANHFRRIMNSTKDEIKKAVLQNPQMRDAVSDAMHVSEKGGGSSGTTKWAEASQTLSSP